ncbi:uncharacterized protein [Henckelia pumila]|uniref:uncharacterized protein n=1 Tax=Henckelia pumila TaxID=405737 RepID=UPI003C6E24AC
MAYNLSLLRNGCDDYLGYDPHEIDVGAGRTHVNINTKIFKVDEYSNLALDFYEKKKQKKFHLVKVVKLNRIGTYYNMTLWAQDDVSDQHHIFRAVVCAVKEKVYLCEIKNDDEMSIRIDHVDEYFQKLGESGEDQPSNTCKNDLGDGYDAGSDGVILVSPTMFHVMGDKLSYLKICDDYLDPCLYKNCGMMTAVNANCCGWVKKYAELAIKIYNQKEQKNFNLIKVEKLYAIFPPSYCMTFWARDCRSDECRLFRAVVCVKGEDEDEYDEDEDEDGMKMSP